MRKVKTMKHYHVHLPCKLKVISHLEVKPGLPIDYNFAIKYPEERIIRSRLLNCLCFELRLALY